MVVRRMIKSENVLPGGGAVEMELSKRLRNESRKIKGKEHLIMNAYAKALEIIPRCLAENAGLPVNEVLNQLRRTHAQKNDGFAYGVNLFDENNFIQNCLDNFIWEPLLIKQNYLKAANEVVCLLLSIDETIQAPQNEEERKMRKQPLPGPAGAQMMKEQQIIKILQ